MLGATPTDEMDKTLALLDAINRADESTTVGDIRKYVAGHSPHGPSPTIPKTLSERMGHA